MSGITFCVYWTSCVFRHILAANLTSFLSKDGKRTAFGAMSKRWQDTTSSDGSTMARARPTNLVLQGHCKEDVSPQRSGSLVNPGNDDERKRVGLASGNWGDIPTQTSKLEIPKWIDKRRLISPQGNLGRETKPERKVKRTPLAERNLMHH